MPGNQGPLRLSPADVARAGLCAACLHAHVVQSARGSQFYRCGRSDADSRFPRYPTLPVIRCSGFDAAKSAPEE
jgi:hypothetical protein